MIEQMYFWITISILAIGTLAIRSSVIVVAGRFRPTARSKEIFGFIPAAILPALALPMVYLHKGQVSWLFGKERLAILILSIAVAYFTKRMTLTLFFGLTSLYLLTHVV